MPRAIDLVIFDCDGVLIDSEPIALELLRRTLADGGLPLPAATVREAFQGRSIAGVRAVLLAVPSLRRVGLAGAVVMHAALVATLWRLDQSWGVILWNLFFLAHEFVLFWPEPASNRLRLTALARTAGPRAWAAAGLIFAAVTLPFGTRAGSWDVWPGWAVYAGGVPKVEARREFTIIHSFVGGYVPPEPVRLDRRALEATGAPLPQDPRVRFGVLSALSRRGDLAVRGRTENWALQYWTFPVGPRFSPPPRRGTTIRRVALGEELPDVDAFRLNARPRALSLPPDAR